MWNVVNVNVLEWIEVLSLIIYEVRNLKGPKFCARNKESFTSFVNWMLFSSQVFNADRKSKLLKGFAVKMSKTFRTETTGTYCTDKRIWLKYNLQSSYIA